MLSRRHYKEIAKIVYGNTCVQIHREHAGYYILKETFIRQLADYLQADNPNFDREKFYLACNIIR